MYKFRTLKNSYTVTSTVIEQGKTDNVFSCKISLEASYNNSTMDYTFTLLDKYDIKLNGKAPEQILDVFMVRLSKSLYPIKLIVSKDGMIKDIANFEDIKSRWRSKCKEIQDESYSVVLDNYISLAENSMTTKWSFIKALRKDTFVQFYFGNYTSDICDVTCYNFPLPQDNTHYQIKKQNTETQKETVTFVYLDDQQGEVRCKFSELQDLLAVEGEFTATQGDAECVKKISVMASKADRQIQRSNRFVSFFLD